MCYCKNVKVGSHNNQVTLITPGWNNRDFISVDLCIAKEVFWLWKQGVMTHGSCCGHNKPTGYIGVYDESIDKMIKLGYENESDKNHFIPQTTYKNYKG